MAPALTQWRSMRTAKVLTPAGSGSSPTGRARRRWRSARRRPVGHIGVVQATRPPTTSECPPKYLVVECTTRRHREPSGSADRGWRRCCRRPEWRPLERVLVRRSPRCPRSRATGCLGVSTQTSRSRPARRHRVDIPGVGSVVVGDSSGRVNCPPVEMCRHRRRGEGSCGRRVRRPPAARRPRRPVHWRRRRRTGPAPSWPVCSSRLLRVGFPDRAYSYF
jgi:hypothetical protein